MTAKDKPGLKDFLARVGKYKSASIDHCKAANDSMPNSECSARNLKEKVPGEARFLARIGKHKSASIDHCKAANDSMMNSEGSARNLKEKVPGEARFLVRLGVTVVAMVLVMYLAKVWFVDQRASGLPSQGRTGGQINMSFLESQPPADTAQVISWRDAAKHYGEYTTVEGTIVATHNSGKVCFLNFHPDYKRYFTAVIFASAFPRFPTNPENHYYGKKVRVSGYIKEYNGKPEIILNDPNQIEILK